ncbi:Cytochrome c heme lyase subunit CcmF [hydrothermal vent metagenome]|uniref:Cytochrome c heme lyase subunit CcmF n=1 Tax=hydrothermal vent metagenome TaxID=652676 RepID=A0A3B1CFC9_9ZZZZ
MLGQILIILSLVSSILSLTMYYFTYKNYENTFKFARIFYHAQFIFILLASAFLLRTILIHDFTNSYVYEYSSTSLSTGLLLSSFFAGQQGSFLLWLLFASLLGFLIKKKLGDDENYESSVMMFYILGLVFLNILVLPGLKDPFESLFASTSYLPIKLVNPAYISLPQIQSFLFTNPNDPGEYIKFGGELKSVLISAGIQPSTFLIEGRGLNPLLQNFWMEIHPPILFLGFAFTAVPFSFALSSLLRNEYKSWIKLSLPWLLWGMAILGAGIMIGGYWAYGVLGWGGYWGWDPVENSSLVPWIIGVALIHTMLIQNKYQNGNGTTKYLRTNLILAILTFVFVIYSTFLTRSGILSDASVHSFVEPGMLTYSALAIFMVGFIAIGAVFLIKRWNDISKLASPIEGWLNRENALFYGSALLIGIAIIISVGTSSPILGSSVKISFYNVMTKPLVIIAGLILGISLFLGWGKTSKKIILRQASVSFIISVIISSLLFYLSDLGGIQNYLFLTAAFFGLVTNLLFFTRNVRNGITLTGGQIAHLGAAILLMGIILNGNLVTKSQADLIKGKKVNINGYDVKYIGYTPIEDGKKFAFDVEFTNAAGSFIASPVMYTSDYNGNLMREPDIKEGFAKDIYISPMGFETAESGSSKEFVIEKGETKPFDDFQVKFDEFIFSEKDMSHMTEGKNFKIFSKITLEKDGKEFEALPFMTNSKGENVFVADTVREAGIIVNMVKMDASGSVLIQLNKIGDKIVEAKLETLSAEISIEPFIILVWIGVFLVTLGSIIAGYRRYFLIKL